MCNRCRVGARDCQYPASLRAAVKDDSPVEAADSSSTSSPDIAISSELPPHYQPQNSSITSIGLPFHALLPWHPNQHVVIEEAMPYPPMFPYSSMFLAPLPLTPQSSIASSTSFIPVSQESYFGIPSTLPCMFNIPRSPAASASRHQAIQFFLKYHQEQVIAAQYFRYYDYSLFYTRALLALGESSDVLRMAIAAFSALVFSFKIHRGARPWPFSTTRKRYKSWD
jgi:hypothetical protein